MSSSSSSKVDQPEDTSFRYIDLGRIDTKFLVPNENLSHLANNTECLYVKYEYPNAIVDSLATITPVVFLPFGLSNYEDGERWSIDVSFYKMEENKVLERLYNVCVALDDWLLELALNNSERWFGKKKTRDVLLDRMTRLVRESKPPGKYAPTLKVHANPRQKQFQFKVYPPNSATEEDEIKCTLENAKTVLPKKSRVQLLLTFPSVWFSPNSFGWSCRCVQVTKYPTSIVVKRPVMQDTDYDEDGNFKRLGMDTAEELCEG